MVSRANSALPIWLWEILASVGIAARIVTVFGAAVVFGVLIAIKIGMEPMDCRGCCLRGSSIRCLASTFMVVVSRYEIVTWHC